MPEVWMRGAVPGVDPFLQPVAHAFLQVKEDLERLATLVSEEEAWTRPGDAASIGFHVRHLGGATDRLLTYARGESLSTSQLAALEGEETAGAPFARVIEWVSSALDDALAQLRSTPGNALLEPRKVGRAGLPSNVLGLLFHAAEHATRHMGQAMTTAKILRGFS